MQSKAVVDDTNLEIQMSLLESEVGGNVTHMVINPNTQSLDGLDLVWVPHDVLVCQEVSEGWNAVLLRRVNSRI